MYIYNTKEIKNHEYESSENENKFFVKSFEYCHNFPIGTNEK